MGVISSWSPDRRFRGAVGPCPSPRRWHRLTQEQAGVLAIVVVDGMATRCRIEEVRGVATLSIGRRIPSLSTWRRSPWDPTP